MMKHEVLETLAPEIRDAIIAAAEWRLISLLLERPVQGWHALVEQLAVEAQNSDLLAAGGFAAVANEETYLSLFGPGGIVSPREVGYAGFEDPGRLFADISAFYAAFSFVPGSEDPADHIAVEAGFVGYLQLKQAYAAMSEDEEAHRVTNEARQRFLEEHLARLARGVHERLQGSAPEYLLMTMKAMTSLLEGVPHAKPIEACEMEDELECAVKCQFF